MGWVPEKNPPGERTVISMNNRSFEAFQSDAKFFVDAIDENGDAEKRIVRVKKACVVISIPYDGGCDFVAFMKTNRGENYRDSRGKKVTKQTNDGPITIIRPLMIGENEVKSELQRLLRCSDLAGDAFAQLQV